MDFTNGFQPSLRSSTSRLASLDPLTNLRELERAEAQRRAEYEQRHAELLRDASRSLGMARRSKSAGTSPVLCPNAGFGMTFMAEDLAPQSVHECTANTCIREWEQPGVPLPPQCHHEDCHKSYRKALKISRRLSGPSMAIPPLSLDGTGLPSNATASRHHLVGATRLHGPQSSGHHPLSPSYHPHSYFPYPRPSPPAVDKEREFYLGSENTSPTGSSILSSHADILSNLPADMTKYNGPYAVTRSVGQAQFTPSASPFLRPLESLGLESPSVSPKLGHSVLGMQFPAEIHPSGDAMLLDSSLGHNLDTSFGKRRDSSTTITQNDFTSACLRPARPPVKSESTPTSPTWRYYPPRNAPHSEEPSSMPVADLGGASTISSPPSPSSRSFSVPQTPFNARGYPTHHHHLAHSVRMAFAMTPINHHKGVPPHSNVQQSLNLTPHHSISSSSSLNSMYGGPVEGLHTPFSHPSSRAGSPPILLPPLSSSTPRSSATTVSSRAPSPAGYITLPPLKGRQVTSLTKNNATVTMGVSEEPATNTYGGGVFLGGEEPLNQGGTAERVKLPGFSEIIRGADS